MDEPVRQLLVRHMSRTDLDVLETLTDGWRRMPFVYDPELAAFSIRDEWLLNIPDSGEETVDVLLRAADILTDHRTELDLGRLGEAPPVEEEASVKIEFPLHKLVAAAHLEELLEGTDYRFQTDQTPTGYVITVWYRYRTDYEYAARKGHLDWLVELAQRLAAGRRFRARRLT
ncbi:MAG: hypothetical protein H0Z37_00315 [Firmicutes bacterium]|nr:hypothetical protein [Bacillota bacterium]